MMKNLIIIFICFALSLSTVISFSQTIERDGYIGVIIKSDENKKIGSNITFANMRTAHPFITFPSGNGAETDKIFEDEEIVILLFVAKVSGSTETYHIKKKSKHFTLIEVGALEAVVSGNDFHPVVSYGTLK